MREIMLLLQSLFKLVVLFGLLAGLAMHMVGGELSDRLFKHIVLLSILAIFITLLDIERKLDHGKDQEVPHGNDS